MKNKYFLPLAFLAFSLIFVFLFSSPTLAFDWNACYNKCNSCSDATTCLDGCQCIKECIATDCKDLAGNMLTQCQANCQKDVPTPICLNQRGSCKESCDLSKEDSLGKQDCKGYPQKTCCGPKKSTDPCDCNKQCQNSSTTCLATCQRNCCERSCSEDDTACKEKCGNPASNPPPPNTTPTQDNTTVNNTSAGAFSYTLLENIPGFEGVTSDFPSYIVAVYKFGIWAIGIAALLMITLGGFMYITSAGNNSSMGKAKGIITDALIGVIMALTAYLLLYTINPKLVSISIFERSGIVSQMNGDKYQGPADTGASCCVKSSTRGEGDYGNYDKNCAQPEGNKCQDGYTLKSGGCGAMEACGGKSGTGKCLPLSSGICSPANLEGICQKLGVNVSWNAEHASAICNAESGGEEGKRSGVDICKDNNVFSWGLFQINLTCQCETAFTPDPPAGRGCANHTCKVTDSGQYNACVKKFTQANENIIAACKEYKSGGWNRWGVNTGPNGCGFKN